MTIDEMVAQFESSPGGREQLKKGRKWLSKQFAKCEGQSLRSTRLSNGLSLSALAALVGRTCAYLARVEGGNARPGAELRVRLCKALDISPERLDRILES